MKTTRLARSVVVLAGVYVLGCSGGGGGGTDGGAGKGESAGAAGNAGSAGKSGTAGGTAGSAGTTGAAAGAGVGAGGTAGNGGTCSVPHRATREVCAATVYVASASCQTDADCPANPWAGHCVPSGGGMQCSYDQCTTDTDCAQPAACLCQGQWFGFSHRSQGNMCGAGNCQVDSDCGGAYCSPTAMSFYGISGYFCHTPRDQCLCDGDCSGGLLCQYNSLLARWSCADPGGAG